MIDDEELIANLKTLDSQRHGSNAAIQPERLVRRVMQLHSRRKKAKRQRVHAIVVGLVGFSIVAALANRYAEQKPLAKSSGPSQQMLTLPVQEPTIASLDQPKLDSQLASSESKDDLADMLADRHLNNALHSELERWRSTHAQLQQQVFELEKTMLREELSRNSTFDFSELTSSLFF